MSGCHHDHGQNANKKILLTAFILTAAFAILEIVFGIISHSLALLSEGIHMFSDGVNLFMSYVAIVIGLKAATALKNFGFRRIETITAFLNGLALLVIPVIIFIEAIKRFTHPREVEGVDMLVVACIGLVINLIVAVMLHKGAQSSMNMRAAALHVLSDLLSSLSTIIAAVVIMKWGLFIVDPILSMLVSISIFIGGYKITKEAFHCLMEGAPVGLDLAVIYEELASIPGVVRVEKLKTWSITSDVNYLTVHITLEQEADYEQMLTEIKERIKKYQVHETIELKK